ncbi:helical backbone metal receptor [Nocardioides limicola]|uniref:helical backbone metal receptor n=1 Tax=Nocardioides limicola TaxID=2803368 RepID=UPI00193C7B32|nr:helical backbone metal receptor [Nocardioides sp. DJM-14]
MRDDLGDAIDLVEPVRRVVSLVPSLTEALASVDPGALVGVTDWCPDLAEPVTRVRGTKNPDLAVIRALQPDLVVANREENRELDVRRLRAAGVPVWVTVIESVPQAVASIRRLLTALDRAEPQWLGEAERLWCGTPPPARATTVVPIWRDPWMVVGRDTFASDLLARAGLPNVLADAADRYPTLTGIEEVQASGADLVLLPDEPYRFGPDDAAEFTHTPTQLVSGRLVTWYGPSLVEAADVLGRIGRSSE